MTHESHFNGDTLTLTSPRGTLVLSQGQCASIVIMAEKHGPVGRVREAHRPAEGDAVEALARILRDLACMSTTLGIARGLLAAIEAGEVPTIGNVTALRAELDAAYKAIGTDAYLDPPDGGTVYLDEQISRMRADLEGKRSDAVKMNERLLGERDAAWEEIRKLQERSKGAEAKSETLRGIIYRVLSVFEEDKPAKECRDYLREEMKIFEGGVMVLTAHNLRELLNAARAEAEVVKAERDEAVKHAAFRLRPILEQTAQALGVGDDWFAMAEAAAQMRAKLEAKEDADLAEVQQLARELMMVNQQLVEQNTALKGRKVTLPGERSTEPTLPLIVARSHGWNDAIKACADALRAAGVEVEA